MNAVTYHHCTNMRASVYVCTQGWMDNKYIIDQNNLKLLENYVLVYDPSSIITTVIPSYSNHAFIDVNNNFGHGLHDEIIPLFAHTCHLR